MFRCLSPRDTPRRRASPACRSGVRARPNTTRGISDPPIGLDEALNTEVLRGIFERFLPAENADDEGPLAELLDHLGAFGVKTGRDVIELLEKHEVALRKAEAEAL